MLTTSGVAVGSIKDPAEKYVTVAAHGFPLGDEAVYHPSISGGRRIGTIQKRLQNTDIALMKLEPGLHYRNQTFETPLQGIPPCDIKHICMKREIRV